MSSDVELPEVQIEFSDELARNLGPDEIGWLTIVWDSEPPESYTFGAAVRSDATPEQMIRFHNWAQVTLAQLAESNDPAANGWTRSDDQGAWYMCAIERQMPLL